MAILAMLVFAIVAGLVFAAMLERNRTAAPTPGQATPAEVRPAPPPAPPK
jgi:hypothetical protein